MATYKIPDEAVEKIRSDLLKITAQEIQDYLSRQSVSIWNRLGNSKPSPIIPDNFNCLSQEEQNEILESTRQQVNNAVVREARRIRVMLVDDPDKEYRLISDEVFKWYCDLAEALTGEKEDDINDYK